MNRSSLPSFLHIPRTFVGMSALAEQRIQVTDVGIREAVRAQSPAQGRRPTPAPPKRCKDRRGAMAIDRGTGSACLPARHRFAHETSQNRLR